MPSNLTRSLIGSHIVSGEMAPGHEIALRIDQALLEDATGVAVMLELEAMRDERVSTSCRCPLSSASSSPEGSRIG
jgi:aconitate hydratase